MTGRPAVVTLLLLILGALFAGWRPASAADANRLDLGPETVVTANQLARPEAHNSPMVAVDPTEPRFMVIAHRLDATDFSCALEVSGDAGRGWIAAQPVAKLPTGAEKCYAPEIAFDRDGTLYYLFVGLAGKGNAPTGAFLTTTRDHGRTFSTPHRVLGAENYAVRMAMDTTMGSRGRLHLVWLHANTASGLGSLPPPPNPILAAFSDDGGATFSPPVQVSDPARQLVVAPALALGPDHAVHVLYYDLGGDLRDYHGLEGPTWDGRWSLVETGSSDGGGRFGGGKVVDDAVVPSERVMLIFTMPPPALVADQSGRLFAAWHDARNGDWDVFLRRSTDGGHTWEGARRLNDDPIHNGRNQYLPRLSVSPGGRVDAVFYDRRLDPENVYNDVFYTYSDDGGQTFHPNRRLTGKASDSKVGQRYIGAAAQGLVEFGSRLGLLSLDGAAVAAWTDTRNATAIVQQEIFLRQVDLVPSTSAGPNRWVIVVAAAGAVVLALAGVLAYRRQARSRRRMATR